ncbi:TAXI family TRAP transporter solute-binding subunit, partial [Planctomycetota bacterium]
MRARNLFLGGAAALTALCLAAPASVTAKDTFRLMTGPDGGTYQTLGDSLKGQVIDGLRIDGIASNGSIGNLVMTSVGQADFCLTQGDAYGYLSDEEDYKEAMAKLQFVLPLYTEEVHVIVTKGSAIKKLADLKGKKVNIGAGASGSAITASIMLSFAGLEPEELTVLQLDSRTALPHVAAGDIDATFVTGGIPLPFLRELPKSAAKNLQLLSIDKETLQ